MSHNLMLMQCNKEQFENYCSLDIDVLRKMDDGILDECFLGWIDRCKVGCYLRVLQAL